MNKKETVKCVANLAMLNDQSQNGFEKTLLFLALPKQEEKPLSQCVLENHLREDKTGVGMPKNTLLSLAPEADEGYITLPRAWEEEKT